MEQEMLDNLKSSSADEELNLRLQMERDQPSESSDGGYDLVYPSRHLGTQMPSHSYDYNGDGIHPVRHQTASANTVKRTRPSGVSAMPGFHTHNYEYTRQEIDSLEEQAHSELRRRVSAEMQNYVSDTPVPPPSPVAPKPAVYVRENDEDEAAAEAEILFRRLNND